MVERASLLFRNRRTSEMKIQFHGTAADPQLNVLHSGVQERAKMSIFNVIACDPGVPLTLALVSASGRLVAIAEKDEVATNFKKNSYHNNAALIGHKMFKWTTWSKLPVKAVVELVGPMPTDGVVSACRFTGSYYMFLGICAGLGIPVEQVTPAKWKRDLGLKFTAETNLKEASRAMAIKEFPDKIDLFKYKKSHDRAEAGLLGLWLLKHGGIS